MFLCLVDLQRKMKYFVDHVGVVYFHEFLLKRYLGLKFHEIHLPLDHMNFDLHSESMDQYPMEYYYRNSEILKYHIKMTFKLLRNEFIKFLVFAKILPIFAPF